MTIVVRDCLLYLYKNEWVEHVVHNELWKDVRPGFEELNEQLQVR